MNDIGSTFFIVFVLVVVLVGAYYTTKFLSGKLRQVSKSKHIHVIDRVGIAKDKALLLTKVGDRCFFIGVTNQAISSLGEINSEEIKSLAEEKADSQNKTVFEKFSAFLSQAKNAPEYFKKARENAKQAQDAQQSDPEKPGVVDDDYVNKISRAIEKRRAAMPGKREEGR